MLTAEEAMVIKMKARKALELTKLYKHTSFLCALNAIYSSISAAAKDGNSKITFFDLRRYEWDAFVNEIISQLKNDGYVVEYFGGEDSFCDLVISWEDAL